MYLCCYKESGVVVHILQVKPTLTSRGLITKGGEVYRQFNKNNCFILLYSGTQQPVVGCTRVVNGNLEVIDSKAYLRWIEDNVFVSISENVQKRLDDFARTRNYSGILSLCSYVNSTNEKFSVEAAYGLEARDDTWAKCYEIMSEVESGQRELPSSYDEIKSELPELVWPE